MISYDFVTTRLATGGSLNGPEDVEILVRAGITHVIDLTWDQPDQRYMTASYFAVHPAISVLWNPTEDDGLTKPPEWFYESINFAFMALSKPSTCVYAHCHDGLNRGPSTAFAIMLALGWEYDAAIEKIHAERPQTKHFIRYARDGANACRELGYCD